jgi:SecD/SecF fusion protein
LFEGFRWRLVMSLVAIAASIYVLATIEPRLGLDLRGGTQIVFEAQDTSEVTVDSEVVQRTVEVLRRRVDGLGVTEPTIQASGDRRIIVELPGVTDPEQAVDIIGRTAQLTFHPVTGGFPLGSEPPVLDEGEQALPDESGFTVIVISPAALIGEHVGNAIPFFEPAMGGWVVRIDFTGPGPVLWASLTGDAACFPAGTPQRRVAIVLDDQVISSPQVGPEISCNIGIAGGTTIITGNFDQDSATQLALLIQAGALPVPIVIIEQGTIGPTLGAAAIDASIQAALIGAALTILYMLAYYRLLGAVAALALIVYAVTTAAVLLWMGATITLPGVAGFVLAIGMAIDANVLVYERAKEEFHGGLPLRDATAAGFKRAWTAIADQNISTLLAAVLLFFFATGPVRGFGITLSVGVVMSMFSALVVARVIIDLLTRITGVANRPALMGMNVGLRFREWLRERNPRLIHRRTLLLSVAALVVAISSVGIIANGFNLGLEFSGGRLLEYETSTPANIDEVRQELAAVGFPRAVVQLSGQGNVIIRTEQLTQEQRDSVTDAVENVVGPAEVVRDQFVGPTLGNELRNRALVALAVALAMQLIYLAFRFRWTMGLASVSAMVHDIAILIGVFAWLGKTIDAVFLAAVLTIIGYSINDSVVIFDRIRENRQRNPEGPVEQLSNDACLQTIPRTINTGLGAVFVPGGPARARGRHPRRLRPGTPHRHLRRHLLLGIRRHAHLCRPRGAIPGSCQRERRAARQERASRGLKGRPQRPT